MYKKSLASLLIGLFLMFCLQPLGKPYAATAPPAQIGDWIKKGKKKVEETAGKVKDKVTNPNKVANEAIATALSKALNDELPLKHDVNSILPPVSIPEESFKPKRLTLTTKNLDQKLPPGDYEIPVTVYCTKGYVSVPGNGVGYALTYMQGKQANAMAMLYLRGAIQGVDRSTIQLISWSIQEGIPYGQMPRETQQIIDKLIPEYRRQLEGDFLQTFEGRYNTITRGLRGSGIPSFDQVISQAGIWGVSVARIKQSRQIIRSNAFNYQRVQQQLISGAIAVDEKFPWAEIRPNVFARLVMGGYDGLNWLQFRYVASAGETITIARVIWGVATVAELIEIGVPVAIIALMAIPIKQIVQSLAISLINNIGSGGKDPCEEGKGFDVDRGQLAQIWNNRRWFLNWLKNTQSLARINNPLNAIQAQQIIDNALRLGMIPDDYPAGLSGEEIRGGWAGIPHFKVDNVHIPIKKGIGDCLKFR